MMGIKPILGCEVYVATRTRFDKEAGKTATLTSYPARQERTGVP